MKGKKMATVALSALMLGTAAGAMAGCSSGGGYSCLLGL